MRVMVDGVEYNDAIGVGIGCGEKHLIVVVPGKEPAKPVVKQLGTMWKHLDIRKESL